MYVCLDNNFQTVKFDALKVKFDSHSYRSVFDQLRSKSAMVAEDWVKSKNKIEKNYYLFLFLKRKL